MKRGRTRYLIRKRQKKKNKMRKRIKSSRKPSYMPRS